MYIQRMRRSPGIMSDFLPEETIKKSVKSTLQLDATDEVVEDVICQKADMLVTHHPLIFGGMKQINNQDFIGRRLLQLLGNDISYYAMHTNYDVCRMAELAGNLLGLKIQKYWMLPECA